MKNLIAVLVMTLACARLLAASEASLSLDITKPNSSSSNRLDKNFTLLASPVGVGPSSNIESGMIAGVFLNPKTILQLEVGDGNTSTKSGFLVFGSGQIKNHTSSTSLAVKYFTGNSFYVKGGVDNRRITYSETYKSSWTLFGTPYEDSFDFSAESWSGSIVIGNQWQWENFTMGCDWFGAAFPFSSKVNSESYATNSSSTDGVKRDLETEQKRRLKDVAYQGIKFYLGASF